MKALKLIALAMVLVGGVSAFADTTWNGPDGGDLTNIANWKDGNPFFDPTTNKSAVTCFNNKPSSNYRVTTSSNVYFGRTYGAGNTTVTFDLYPYSMCCCAGDPLYMPGGTGRRFVFESGTFCNSNATLTAASTFTMQQNAKKCEVVFTGPNTLALGGWNIRDAYDSRIILTNGAHMSGMPSVTGYSNNTVVVTGSGTVLDCRNGSISLGNHATSAGIRDGFNAFIVTNGASVVNLNGVTLDSNGNSDDGLVYLEGVTGNDITIGLGGKRNQLKLVDSFFSCKNSFIGKGGAYSVLDIGRGASVSYASGGGGQYFWIGNNASAYGSGVRIHDGGSFTNASGEAFVGYNARDCFIDVYDGGFLKGIGSIQVSGTSNGWLRVRGAGSKAEIAKLVVGADKQVNGGHALLVEDGAVYEGGTSLKMAGFHNRVVVSNATLKSALLYDFQNGGWGGTNLLVVAGRKAKVEIAGLFDWVAASTVRFDIPEEGYESVPITASKVNMSRAEFDVSKIQKTGGVVTLVSTTTSLTLSDAALAKMQQGLPLGCKLKKTDKELILKVSKGLMILVR